MHSRLLLALTPCALLVAVAIAACGNTPPPVGTVSDDSGIGASGTSTSGTGSGGTGAGSGSSTGSGATSGGGTGAASGGGTGAASGGGSGAASGAGSGTTGDAGGSGAAGSGGGSGSASGPLVSMPSPGCSKASTWTGATGMFVQQPVGCNGPGKIGAPPCVAIPPGSTPSTTAQPTSSTQAEWRGWWTLVPNGYVVDPTKPYKVIYEAASCGDSNYFHAGADGYNFNAVDNGQAILVGLDYDTYSSVPGCYDNRSPNSNDFTFFPWLQSQIESQFCVDMNHEFFSGYSSGAWLAQQLNCAYPDKLRGFVSATGCEPGTPADPGGSQPTCVSKPTAYFHVHDYNDVANPYACATPGCLRVLNQNGCMLNGAAYTKCDPTDMTVTSPYMPPAGVTLPQATYCRSFNGCPTDYPVVFCVTNNQTKTDGSNWGVVPLFWDWMANKLK
jgi:hypothetical protein